MPTKATPLQKRKQYLAALSRIDQFIKTENLTKSHIFELKSRLSQLPTIWERFGEVQADLEAKDESETEVRISFENLYFGVHAKIQELIHNIEEAKPPPAEPLPVAPINIQKFNGDYREWLGFRDSFLTLIHRNSKLNNIQKFYHLKASLGPEVLETIKAIAVSDDNYLAAWEQLINRYEKTHLIANHHINAILKHPQIVKDSSRPLRSLFNSIKNNLESLKNLGVPVQHWDLLLIPLISSKLDPVTNREWERYAVDKKEISLQNLLEIISNRAEFLENMEMKGATPNVKTPQFNQTSSKINSHKHCSINHVQSVENKCKICSATYHPPFKCNSLLKATPQERLQKVRNAGLCVNCLRSGHSSQDCHSSKCKLCGKAHNTLLHFESPSQNPLPPDEKHSESASVAMTQIHCNENSPSRNQVLLPTAIIELEGINKQMHRCRVLLDSGAMSNFISTSLCKKLGLSTEPVHCTLKGIGQSIQKTHLMAKIQFKLPFEPQVKIHASCLVIDTITSHLPMFSLNLNEIKIPKFVTLADPTFNKSSKIDILLGSSVFWDLLSQRQVKIPNTNLTLQETKLGWVVGGRFTTDRKGWSINNHSVDCLVTCDNSLENRVKQFWEIEEIENRNTMSPEDQFCEELFARTHSRSEDGHYTVQIPFKSNFKQLGDSREAALKRFKSLETKLSNNAPLHAEYCKIMREYKQMGHMKEVNESLSPELSKYYIPHHAVVKQDSLTTKTRVVFDASLKSTSGLSLNDVQYIGPTIQNELFSILMNFRLHKYVICGDISKMYRMIWLHDDHKPFHRIFWREHKNEPLRCYELQTVTFGTASAPYLAIRCLKQIAIEHEQSFPMASQIIKNNFYVDDLVFGTESIPELIQLQHEICGILSSAGFQLRKWLCNHEDIYDQLKLNANLDCNTLEFGNKANKTLGVVWNAQLDKILYSNLNLNQNSAITKRTVLSELSKLFDPLGLLGPIITVGKLLMQQLWQLKMSWDEPLPSEYSIQWSHFRSEINSLPLVEVNRKVLIDNYTSVELHGFCDASEKAYGAAVFIKSKNDQGQVHTSLLCSKSRIAPLKVISIPKLELCGALLLAKLVSKVSRTIEITIEHKYYWSDSTITLAWIRSHPGKWKTFVANRVSMIQELTEKSDWHHVSSADNPADLLSRGTTVSNLIETQQWWSGPTLIQAEVLLTDEEPEFPDTIPESKGTHLVNNVATITEQIDLIHKFSTFKKLLRVVAYCFRFKTNCQSNSNNKRYGELSPEELNYASNSLIRLMQSEAFPEDYSNLAKHKEVGAKSNLSSLNPFLDNNGIIRVGGRLDNSQLNFDAKHPIILPSKHYLSKLIINQLHSDNLHCGPTTLLAIVRQKYWPLRGRNLIRGITRNCKICFLSRPRACEYLMGQLPSVRITPGFPFQSVGIDYAGPISIRDRKTRGHKAIKAYICLFICMATKAIHLECVTELTTHGFLACLRRFVSRRGKPSHIYSDNGKNFVGASREIRQISQSEPVAQFLAHEQITWHFIPARAPTFGGIWEAAVKSVKTYLYKLIRNINIHYEDLSTILCQIEAVVNSRPLTPLTSDPSDLTPLTPGHFLIGRSFTQHPEINSESSCPPSRSKHYQLLKQIIDHFWQRWSAEYIAQLQVRSKWQRRRPDDQAALAIGKLVLIKGEPTAALQWPLGRIVQLHPGPDGIIRAVSVKVKNSTIRRGVSKICILPED